MLDLWHIMDISDLVNIVETAEVADTTMGTVVTLGLCVTQPIILPIIMSWPKRGHRAVPHLKI